MRGFTEKVLTAAESVSLAVAGNVTVYTKSFPLYNSDYFATWYRATSSGVVDVGIILETSWTKPTTEGAADNNYSTPDNLATIDTLVAAASTFHHKSLNPPFAMYGRFKLVGGATNDASTVLTMHVGQQER